MDNKLQELTKRLYDEGLSKGRQQADTLVSEAQAKAKKIVDDAKAEAERLKRQSEDAAADLRKNTLTELNLAGKQVIETLKSDINSMIVAKSVDKTVSDAMLDPAFVKEVLIAAARNWNGASGEPVSLKVMLPADTEKKLSSAVEAEVSKSLKDGVEIEYSNGVKSGFRIGPKDGGYYIDFSEAGFNALLAEYLRPKVSEMLYGNQE